MKGTIYKNRGTINENEGTINNIGGTIYESNDSWILAVMAPHKKTALDYLRMPKLQEIFTTVAIMSHL